MIIYFTEEDLVTFGTYMISAERRKSIESNPELTYEMVTERLKSVTDADIQNWAYLISQRNDK